MPAPIDQPSWRKPVGMFLILVLIFVWAILAMIFTPAILSLPWPLQALFFAIFGTVWIFPLKPLLRWMELGRFR
jgi:predicted membrane channel-forming protein YqfA (hemolysin III family)